MDKNEAKLKRLLSLMDEDSLTKEDFIKNFEVVLEFARKTREFTESEVENIKSTIESILGGIKETNTTEFTLLKSQLTKRISAEISKFNEDTLKKWQRIQERIDSVRDGVDADEDIIVGKVLGKIKLPEYKETVLDTPEQLRDKLEELEGDERLDKSAIKGLDEAFDSVMQSIPRNGGGSGGVEVFNSTGKVGSGSALKFIGSGVSSISSDGHTSTITLGGGSSLTVQDIDGTPTVSNVTAIKFTNGSVADNGDGTVNVTTGAGGGGDVSSTTATSVDSEVALFSGTGGKTIKRSTLTATVVGSSSGVLSSTATTGSGTTVALSTSPDLTTPDINVATADSLQAGTTSAGLLLKNNAGTTVASFGVGSSSSTNIALIGATTVTGNISATNLSGTNTGDQTSIVGITGTKAQFDTAVTDGNFLYVGDVTQYTDELAQDAVGAMVANSTFVNLTYNDATPSLTPSLSATGTPSSSTFLRGDNTWATPGGSGTVTASGGSLTANSVVLGAGTTDTKVVSGITTDGTSQLNLGVNATTLGKVKMFGNTSGDATIQPSAVAGTATVQTLPATTGTLVNRVTTANGVSASNSDGALSFTLGAITPSTVNGNTITTGTGTLTLGAGKTLTASNTITLAGTDSSTLNIGAGGTLGSAAYTASSAYEVPLTFSTGLTRTTNTVTVNTSQNIATLSNLTSNGIVTTSGGTGTLSVTATTGSGSVVLATSPTLTTPVLGTPSSGTLTNCTGLPVSGITASTSTALGVGSIELGHASDTTLSRSSAGVLAVEGVVVPTISSTSTLTNKRVTKRTGTTTSSATPTINTDNVDFYSITAQTVDITSFTTNLSGTPTEGQTLWIAITGTAARAITWGSSFEASTVALPTTTVSTNRLDVGFVWNTVTSKWRCISSC